MGIWSPIASAISRVKQIFQPKNGANAKSQAAAPAKPNGLLLKEWDKGIFASELVSQDLMPRHVETNGTRFITPPKANVPPPLSSGTFHGSQVAATEMFNRIEQRFASFFDVANFESSIPQSMTLADKQKLYTYQASGSDKYPPHLNMIPPEDQVNLLQIFDAMRLLDTGTLLGRVIPEQILDFVHGNPDDGHTIADIEARNNTLRSQKKDIFTEPNIGDRADWYTDAVFAQQQFTGTNPTTITIVTAEKLSQFKAAAVAQKNQRMMDLLENAADSLYMNDYSYFRAAVGAAAGATLISDDKTRWACAAISLFHLNPDGKLHPVAICLDYKEDMAASVVIFNKRVSPRDSTASEKTDWPWRYAKLCAQISDWSRHEMTIHLTNTHFVEEAVIVASHRTLPPDHIVYRLLEPHWYKTLSLNAAARSSLVPSVVVNIVGITDSQVYAFCRDAYNRFDWTGLYIPNDLARRGFPVSQLNTTKFHNYVYGKNMALMWSVLRKFVATIIATKYANNDAVTADPAITAWYTEMRSPTGGAMKAFPEIKTVDDLVDAITMCIHIASPQHTAVNYLQEYYQSFVINKPPALCSPLPATLADLNAYKEADLMRALPVNRPREWLMASHLPHLLSFRVAEDQNLPNYALSLAKLAGQKADTDPVEKVVADAAKTLYTDLADCAKMFGANSKQMDDQTLPYTVMDPGVTASSILL